MYYLIMDWYARFQCAAGDCPYTCCTTDWDILVDEESYKKYQKLDTEFGRKLVSLIDPETRKVRAVSQDGRCPLLDADGLCEIVKQEGSGSLCATCAVYPRNKRVFGEIEEWNVNISCPVVAGFLLSGEKIGFIYEEAPDVKGGKKEPFDYRTYNAMALARTFCVELLQERQDLPLIGRLYMLKRINDAVQELWKKGCVTQEQVRQALLPYENVSYLEELSDQIVRLHKNTEAKYYAVLNMLHNLPAALKDNLSQEVRSLGYVLLDDKDAFCRKAEEFGIWCRQYERAYENYFVYQLFVSFIDMPKGRSYFESAALEFLYIQLMAMSAWEKQELTKERYRDIIVKTARSSEHRRNYQDEMIKALKERQMTEGAYLLFWLLV